MGWDFRTLPCDKQEIIEECVKSICSMECLKHSVQGNELWSVWQKKDGTRVILLFLLASKDRCWGYKEIAEESGPYYYKCPMGFLEMAAVANQDWRNKVYEYHDRRLRNLSALKKIRLGTIVTLDVPDNDFRVTHMNPFLGVNTKSGRLYRLVKSRVIAVREGEPVKTFRLPVSIEQVGL